MLMKISLPFYAAALLCFSAPTFATAEDGQKPNHGEVQQSDIDFHQGLVSAGKVSNTADDLLDLSSRILAPAVLPPMDEKNPIPKHTPYVLVEAVDAPIHRISSQVTAHLVLMEKDLSVATYMDAHSEETGLKYHAYNLNDYEKKALAEKGSAASAVEIMLGDIADVLDAKARTPKEEIGNEPPHIHIAIEIPEKLTADDTKFQLEHLRDVLAARGFKIGSDYFSLRETDFYIFARASAELNLPGLALLQGNQARNVAHIYLLQHGYPESLLNAVGKVGWFFRNDCNTALAEED